MWPTCEKMNVAAPISHSRQPSFQRAARKIASPTGIAIINNPFSRWVKKRISMSSAFYFKFIRISSDIVPLVIPI